MPKDHVVAQSLQRNWADEVGHVAVVDRTRRTWTRGVPSRELFMEDVTSFHDGQDWRHDLDEEFKTIESANAEAVRSLNSGAHGDEERQAAARLCVLHFARSYSLVRFLDRAKGEVLEDFGDGTPAHLEAFRSEVGRDPDAGELQAMADDAMEQLYTSNQPVASGIARAFLDIDEYLGGKFMQVVTIAPGPVTFALADSPVVLSDHQRRAGSADNPIPLRKAAEIWFPTGPRTGISFSTTPTQDCVLTPLGAQTLNRRSWDWSIGKLICTVDDGPHNAFGRPASSLREVKGRHTHCNCR